MRYCLLKDLKSKKSNHRVEKIFVIYIYNKVFEYWKYIENPVNQKKIILKNCGKDINRHFKSKDIQMKNKLKYSTTHEEHMH